MWIFPVLLDARPAFLPPGDAGSLLMAPLGTGRVLDRLRLALSVVTQAPPVVLACFPADEAYGQAVRSAYPDVERVETTDSFATHCRSYEPSDWLIFADPASLPRDPRDPALLALGQDADPRWVKHLVALDGGSDGTRELVEIDPEGRVRGIRRYYDSMTWPLASGVSCSLVSVASLLLSDHLPLASLRDLRRALAAHGVSSRDVPLRHGAVDLSRERGLLALNERALLDLQRARAQSEDARAPLHVGQGCSIHPSARFLGPVVVQDGAVVEERATVIGPTAIGSAAHIGRDAIVAQCLIGHGQHVAAGATVRHRALLDGHSGHAGAASPSTSGMAPAGDPEQAAEPWPTSLELARRKPARAYYPPVKRAIDLVAAALGLLILAPFGALIALFVKLSSSGPVFFGHPREGLHGRPFRCWKFRTMIVGADLQQRALTQKNQNEVDGPQFKVDSDPRYTRLGRFLSTSTLDELPQLFNVLLGQMSLVGPRPSPFRENQLCIPWREARLSVRPGVTGLWQVCRHDRHKGDFHQWIYYDTLYVRHLSLWLDLRILALTLLSLAHRGHIPLSWLLSPRKYGERRGTSPSEPGAPWPERRTSP